MGKHNPNDGIRIEGASIDTILFLLFIRLISREKGIMCHVCFASAIDNTTGQLPGFYQNSEGNMPRK